MYSRVWCFMLWTGFYCLFLISIFSVFTDLGVFKRIYLMIKTDRLHCFRPMYVVRIVKMLLMPRIWSVSCQSSHFWRNVEAKTFGEPMNKFGYNFLQENPLIMANLARGEDISFFFFPNTWSKFLSDKHFNFSYM